MRLVVIVVVLVAIAVPIAILAVRLRRGDEPVSGGSMGRQILRGKKEDWGPKS
jgi:hypothetical protein